jgi:hypothetical protein
MLFNVQIKVQLFSDQVKSKFLLVLSILLAG